LNRRQFLRKLAALWGLAVVGPLVEACRWQRDRGRTRVALDAGYVIPREMLFPARLRHQAGTHRARTA